MSHLPNTTTAPPGGWRYLVPETQKLLRGTNLPELIGAIRSHLQGTGYNLPHDIAQRIEAYICEQPESREYCGGGHVATGSAFVSAVKGVVHTFHAAISCLSSLVSHRAGTGERPNQALADTRAAICAACPKNVEITGCKSCNQAVLNMMVGKIVGVGKTQFDGQLKFCEVCHCNNKAKIWTKHEAIWKFMPEAQKKQLDPNCWILKEAKE